MMMRWGFIAFVALLDAPLFGATSALAGDGSTCEPSAVSAAFRAGDVGTLEALFASASRPDAKCADSARFCIGRVLAIAYSNRAMAAAASDASLDTLRSILDKGKTFGQPWPLLTALGDVALAHASDGDKRQFSEAATDYELALNDLSEKTVCSAYGEPDSSSVSQIAILHKHMEEAKLLAPTFNLVRTRSGECGGIFLQNVRGFEPEDVPLPIKFDSNSTKFTPEGLKAAEALAECVGGSHASNILLTGHADARGTDAYNMDLSARRLQAVKAFLVQHGYQGALKLEPKGKRDPWKPTSDLAHYTDEDILQLNRRVELRSATR